MNVDNVEYVKEINDLNLLQTVTENTNVLVQDDATKYIGLINAVKQAIALLQEVEAQSISVSGDVEIDGASVTTALSNIENTIGDLTNLSTTVQTDVVSAINEVDSHADTNASNIGTLSSLATTAKNNLVAAINELNTNIQQIPDGIVPKGTIAFANLPSLSDVEVGWMYNISDNFTTTSDFITSGIAEKAGSNVYVADIGSGTKKWDVFAVAPDIVVDQTYDGTSTNPQSGTAVAQAVDANTGLPAVECLTAYDTAAKEVTLPNFELKKGATLLIKFTNNTSTYTSNRTLNVNNTGDIALYVNGSRSTTIPTTATTTYYPVTYDGSYWQMETSYVNYLVRKYGITSTGNNTNGFSCWSSMTFGGTTRYFHQTNLSAGDGISITSSSSAPKTTYTVKLANNGQALTDTVRTGTVDSDTGEATVSSATGAYFGDTNFKTFMSALGNTGVFSMTDGGTSRDNIEYTFSDSAFTYDSGESGLFIDSSYSASLANWLVEGNESSQSSTNPHAGRDVGTTQYALISSDTSIQPVIMKCTSTLWDSFQNAWDLYSGWTNYDNDVSFGSMTYGVEANYFSLDSSASSFFEYMSRSGETFTLVSYSLGTEYKLCGNENVMNLIRGLVFGGNRRPVLTLANTDIKTQSASATALQKIFEYYCIQRLGYTCDYNTNVADEDGNNSYWIPVQGWLGSLQIVGLSVGTMQYNYNDFRVRYINSSGSIAEATVYTASTYNSADLNLFW